MLQLRIYPISDANTFIGLAEADFILNYSTDYQDWEALSAEDKTRYLIKAFNDIIMLEGLTIPSPTPECLKEAQADTALRYITNALSDVDGKIKSEKLGPMTTVYMDGSYNPLSLYSVKSLACLMDLGVIYFGSQGALGSMPKTR